MYDIDEELENEPGIFDDEYQELPAADDYIPLEDEEGIFNDDDEQLEEGTKLSKNSLIDSLLELRGIKDGKITFIDEDNKETTVSFYNLKKEEQLEILAGTEQVQEEPSYSNDDEEEFLKYLKDNNLSIKDYLDKYRQATIAQLEQTYEKSYDIDSYGDEELFLLDLKTKYDLTDEELDKELTKALEDKDLFTKKVGKLRQEYKELEDAYNKEQENIYNQKRQEEYQTFAYNMVEVAKKNSEFYGIELDDTDKNEVLTFLLDLDDNGTSEFYRQLNNPEKLYEAAWFLKYGKEAFEALTDGYEQEIKRLKEEKGGKTTTIVKKKPIKSIYELD